MNNDTKVTVYEKELKEWKNMEEMNEDGKTEGKQSLRFAPAECVWVEWNLRVL